MTNRPQTLRTSPPLWIKTSECNHSHPFRTPQVLLHPHISCPSSHLRLPVRLIPPGITSETRAPSTRPTPSLVISAPINPAPSLQSSPPPLFLEPYHQAPGVHSPRISRPFLPEPTSARYFPRVSPTPRIPEVPGLQSPPHPPTHSGEYQAMHTQAGVSIVPTPTRHPDERSDADMQYLAHADLSTRLG